ncbi:MAG: short-subunit dehydrogenase [Paracoccaceae bacterium]
MRKNILITGASSGLGYEMAKQFAAKGRNLALCARREDQLQALKAELLEIDGSIDVLIKPLDVLDYDAVERVFNEVHSHFGVLDRVIVNAGMGKGQALGKGYFHANRKTAETNFVAAIAQCDAAMAIFRKQNAGHLVAISSMAGLRGMSGTTMVYSATKAGVAVLMEGLQMELLDSPINCTTIFPGYILTDINRDMKKVMFRADLESGTRSIVKAIEREKPKAYVPGITWWILGHIMRRLPLRILKKAGGQ